MREIAISKFKATCLAVLEDVRRTGVPVLVTRFGQPMAEVTPPRQAKSASWLGCMKDTLEVSGDISGPIGAFRHWTANRK
jgi:antitoxin (DNA-binding transcriptional repressor) of toxin-antitoxin stability system